MAENPAYGRPRSWREGDRTPEAQVRTAKQARRKKLYIATALLLILVGAAAALFQIFKPQPEVTFFPVCVTQYKMEPKGYGQHAGLNPMAEMDRQSLKAMPWFVKDTPLRFKLPEAANPWSAQYDRSAMLAQMGELERNAAQNPQPVVLYLNAFARVRNGRVLLLFSDSLTDKPDDGVYLKDFLVELAKVGQGNPKVKKLLILDLAHPLLDPRRGMLNTDVAAMIPAELKAHQDPHLAVLTSCSAGQVSHMAEELGHSAFAYYLEQGLHGYADGWDPKGNPKKDGISVRELAHYVRFHVDRWARAARGARQTPELIVPEGSDDYDFNMVIALSRPPITPAGATSAQPVLHWEKAFRIIADSEPELNGAYPVRWWEMHDQWERDRVRATSPEAMAYLEIHLLDIETRWRNGEPISGLEPEWQQHLQVAQTMRAKAPQPGRSPTDRGKMSSIVQFLNAELKARGRTGNEPYVRDWVKKLHGHSANFNGATPEEQKDKLKDTVKYMHDVFKKDEMELQGIKKYPDFMAAAWRALLEERSPTVSRLKLYSAFLGQLREDPELVDLDIGQRDWPYVETVMLKRLLALPDAGAPEMQELLRSAIELMEMGEEVLARDEPGTLVWLQGSLQDAVRKRQQAEVMLFSPGYVRLEDTKAKYEEAKAAYKMLNENMYVIQTARARAQESLAYLPYHIAYLQALPSSRRGAQAEAPVRELIRGTQDLQQALMPPEDPSQLSEDQLGRALARIRPATARVEKGLNDLRRPLQNREGAPAFTKLLEDLKSNKGVEDLEQATALLELPFFSAEDRRAIWEVRQGLMDIQRKKWQEADKLSFDKTTQQMPTAETDGETKARTLFMVNMGLEMLRLAPVQNPYNGAAADLKKARLEEAQDAPQFSKALQEAGDSLRLRWDEVAKLTPGNDFQADWLIRMQYAGKQAYTKIDELPSLKLQRTERAQMRNCLGQIHQYLAQELADWQDNDSQNLIKVHNGETSFYRPEKQLRPGLLRDPRNPIVFGAGANEQDPKKAMLRTDPADKDVGVKILSDERALTSHVNREKNELSVSLRRDQRTDGFIVQLLVDGWPYHFRWKVVTAKVEAMPELLFAMNPNDTKQPLVSPARLDLRAIENQPLLVFVRNPTNKLRKVQVKLRFGDTPESTSEPLDVPPKGERPVMFRKVTRGKLEWDSEAVSPPVLGFELYELEGTNVNLIEQATVQVTPRLMSPAEFIRPQAEYIPGKDGKSGSLELKFTTIGQRKLGRKVKLTASLPKDRNPTLNFKGIADYSNVSFLEGDATSVAMTIPDLKLDGDGPLEIHVQVDDYPRGFILLVSETNTSTNVPGLPLGERRVLIADNNRFVASNRPYEATLEVDRLNDRDVVRIDWADKADGFGETDKLTGNRLAHITMTVNEADGLLQFTGTAFDHKLKKQLNLGTGKRFLVIRVENANGQKLDARVPEAFEIRIDPADPEVSVASMNLPGKDSQELIVRVKARDADSGVKKVQVFRGTFTEGKPPPGVTPVEAKQQDGGDIWIARVPVSRNDANVTLTIMATDGAGRQTRIENFFDVNSARNQPEEVKPGTIEVKVVIDDKDSLPGVDAEVTAFKQDEKTKQFAEVTSGKANPNGICTFRDLAPGTYIFVAKLENQFGKHQGKSDAVPVVSGDNNKSAKVSVKK